MSEHPFQLSAYSGTLEYDVLEDPSVLSELFQTQATDEFIFYDYNAERKLALYSSPTHSTQGHAGPAAAKFEVSYFGGREDPNAWDWRSDYFRAKLLALATALEAIGAELRFVGLTATARQKVTGANADAERAKVFEALMRSSFLSDSDAVRDFALRASEAAGKDAFLNTTISWFQTRRLSMARPVSGDSMVVPMIRQWEGVMDAQGIEVKFDFNNKKALYEGRIDWTAQSAQELCSHGLDRLPGAFSRIMQLLSLRDQVQ